MQKIDSNLNIKLVPYRVIPDKGHFIVELLRTNEFYEMPQPAIDAIEALVKEIKPEQIELELKEKYPNEDINIIAFITQLDEMGFLVKDEANREWSDDLYAEVHVTSSARQWGQLLFNSKLIPLYTLFIIANVILFILHPTIFPRPEHLFPFTSMVFNVLVAMIVTIILLAIHECAHVLAARALGLITHIGFSHRLFLPVIETQMPTIWRLPREKRNIPLLAGLFADHTILFFTLIIMLYVPSLNVIWTGILGLVVLQLVMMTLYQCMFFMKTDLYYLFQNVTGSYNLMENAEGWLKSKLPIVKNSQQAVIYEKEENIVKGYAVFYILGLLASLIVLVGYVIPQLQHSIMISYDHLFSSQPIALRLDAIIFFSQFFGFACLIIYSWSKSSRRTS